jgi:D-aspartate ligase
MRSLGRLGVPIYNIDPNIFAPAFFSRYCRGRFFGDVEQWPVERALDCLQNVRKKIGRPAILIPTTDDASMFVADNTSILKEWFIFPRLPSSKVCSLSNKKQMYQVAKDFHIPTPVTIFPQSREDVLAFIGNATFPVMLKAIDGTRLWRRTGQKMWIIRSESELLREYDEMEDPGDLNLMLQEYIPGGDDTIWMFDGYFNEKSECLISFTGKKIRQYPIHKGVTSLGECVANPVITKKTVEFLKAFGYCGIVDLGYRFDQRDGSYKILDINPRIGATFRLFVDGNGMDVARALYLDLTGQPVICGVPPNGRRWIVEDFDFVSSVRYGFEGKLSLKEWLASLRGVEEAAYFAADDILPVLPMFLSGISRLVKRSLQTIAGALGLRRHIYRPRNISRIRSAYRFQK